MHRISRFLSTALALATLGFSAFSPLPAAAQVIDATVRPLVVIRFNQPRVYFDQQLYGALSQAVAIKPEVMFEVVSFAPTTGQNDRDAQWQQAASQHTQAVVASMQSMGIPLERIRVTGQLQTGLRYDETHVFVR